MSLGVLLRWDGKFGASDWRMDGLRLKTDVFFWRRNMQHETTFCSFCYIWVFPKIGEPQHGWFIMENHIRMGWFGGPTIFGNIHIRLYASSISFEGGAKMLYWIHEFVDIYCWEKFKKICHFRGVSKWRYRPYFWVIFGKLAGNTQRRGPLKQKKSRFNCDGHWHASITPRNFKISVHRTFLSRYC